MVNKNNRKRQMTNAVKCNKRKQQQQQTATPNATATTIIIIPNILRLFCLLIYLILICGRVE